MAMSGWATGLALLIALALAFPYVRHVKHRDSRPFAAYLLFVAVFALVAGVLYAALGAAVVALDLGPQLARPAGAVLFLCAIFVPAFLVARWQIRRRPRRVLLP